MKTRQFSRWIFFFALLLAACQSGSSESPVDADDNKIGSDDPAEPAALTEDLFLVAAVGDFSNEHLCSRGFDLGFADLDAAAQTPTMNADFSEGRLGLAGAESLMGEFFDPQDTFCGADLEPETQAALAEIDQLIEDGDLAEARQQLEDLLEDLQAETGAVIRVRASLPRQLNKEQTYRFVKTFLSSAARFQVLGMDDYANEAISEAQETFSKYAEAVLETSTDIKELLTIAAQYQLLGEMEGLDQEAIEKASEFADQKVQNLLSSFNPCEASRDQITEILKALALSQVLGGDSSLTFEVQDAFETARRNKQAEAEGESIPECEGAWIVELHAANGGLEIDLIVRSCDGVKWEGEHTHKGNMLGGAAIINLAAMFDFTVPGAGQSTTIDSGEVIYDSAGTWIVGSGGDSGVATVTNNFSFSMELDRTNSSAIVNVVSNGGTFTMEGSSFPVPHLFGPGDDVPAQVSVNEACSN